MTHAIREAAPQQQFLIAPRATVEATLPIRVSSERRRPRAPAQRFIALLNRPSTRAPLRAKGFEA
jgi:hypothetical protein